MPLALEASEAASARAGRNAGGKADPAGGSV
eukprot:CAMPEP_0113295076 /NCGR_PEP_ID=MMETSP0008_2-20120614/36253_1 /TAXON_ID=97485 /ORGANISM="Prymnesium parvum" /LENGTH=30 /DNA_ID=CAMNT_0000147759 /DNA_START=530 /DNA_END=618 /DNA_ORIENTATION=- /assembly_acc=CAM_ASM_000153